MAIKQIHIYVEFNTSVEYATFMNSKELIRDLTKNHGVRIIANRGKGGHVMAYLGDRKATIPMHGRKDLKTGLVNAIYKQLGIK